MRDDAAPMARLAVQPPPLPVSPVAAPFVAAPGSMDPTQVQELLQAQARVSKLRRAANVARFDGWTIGFFGVVTVLTGFTSPSSLLLGIGMTIAAYVEFKGAANLRKLAPTAARHLAMNQVCLGALLMLYSAWQLYAGMSGGSSYASLTSGDPQMAQMLAPVESLTRAVTITVYASLIAIAIFMQGGTALYYLSRQKHLDEYVRTTPKWILDLQRAGVAV